MGVRGQGASDRLAVPRTVILLYLQLIRSVVCVAAKGELKRRTTYQPLGPLFMLQ